MVKQEIIYYAILFLPGIIFVRILDFIRLDTSYENKTRFYLHSFLWSIFLYSIIQIIFPDFNFLTRLSGETKILSQADIKTLLLTSLLGLFLAFLYNILMMNGIIYKILRLFKITSAISHQSVFEDIYNLKLTNGAWTTIFLNDSPLHFTGGISKYKLYDDNIEILLKEVTVYSNESGEKLYDVSFLYLRKPYHLLRIQYD